ncbi:MAG: hypothetical protein JOY82_11655 [Streptosporangiaceae bacterium]|nr:hypothetical protein [Streptosporangiaceae bacterium]
MQLVLWAVLKRKVTRPETGVAWSTARMVRLGAVLVVAGALGCGAVGNIGDRPPASHVMTLTGFCLPATDPVTGISTTSNCPPTIPGNQNVTIPPTQTDPSLGNLQTGSLGTDNSNLNQQIQQALTVTGSADTSNTNSATDNSVTTGNASVTTTSQANQDTVTVTCPDGSTAATQSDCPAAPWVSPPVTILCPGGQHNDGNGNCVADTPPVTVPASTQVTMPSTQVNTSFVCSDGSTVATASDCPAQPNTTATDTPATQTATDQCGAGSAGNAPASCGQQAQNSAQATSQNQGGATVSCPSGQHDDGTGTCVTDTPAGAPAADPQSAQCQPGDQLCQQSQPSNACQLSAEELLQQILNEETASETAFQQLFLQALAGQAAIKAGMTVAAQVNGQNGLSAQNISDLVKNGTLGPADLAAAYLQAAQQLAAESGGSGQGPSTTCGQNPGQQNLPGTSPDKNLSASNPDPNNPGPNDPNAGNPQQSPSGADDLGPGWTPRDPSTICRSTGCEDVAKEIQQKIGGTIYRIEDSAGARYLGKYRGEDTYWNYHEVVIKDGRVYDAWTGRYGEPFDQYVNEWQYGKYLRFTPVS